MASNIPDTPLLLAMVDHGKDTSALLALDVINAL